MNFDKLVPGSEIAYSGELLVMRDAAQKRIQQFLKAGKEINVDFDGKLVFYAGPAKTPTGRPIGAIGPTTSERMDGYLEMLFQLGVKGTIGKGRRSKQAGRMCQKYKGVYFLTPSGSAAALSLRVKEHRVILFPDLQSEAVRLLRVEKFPLVVAIDIQGNDISRINR